MEITAGFPGFVSVSFFSNCYHFLNRVRMDARFGHHAEVSDLLPEGDSKNYGASSEKNKLLSSDNQSDDGSKQFNMLYHRTSRGSIEDVISGKTHITELHAVPGYTYMINSCSSQDVRSNNSPNIQTNDLTNNVRYNRQLNDLKQEKAASSTSSIDKTKSSRADLRTNLKEYSARHAASDDDPVNVKHHSRSSSNYSASSGEIPYPDSTYISISDINLRTRPSRVPPPSRAPPKLASKQEHNKSRQIHYSIGASRSHGRQGVAKDSSSHFLDVEVDASSAAKASAAAMKEAMEQAEARLKSAKELLERKRDIRKKPAHKEGAKYDESKEVKDSDVVKDFSELTARKLLPKGSKGMKEYALNDTNKGTKVGKVSPNHGEQERYVVTAEESHQMGQGNGFKSSQMCYKSEEVSGEWKNVDQFYELINNEKKSRAVKEASQQEDVEKKTKTTTKVNEEKEIYSEKDELANEFKRTVKLHKVNETIERDDIDGNPKVCNMTSKQEFRKIPDEILETCILNEPEASSSSYHRNANKKMQAAQEALISGGELKKPDAVEEASCEENEMNLESSNNSFRFEEIYHDDEVNRKLQPAKEASEHGEEEEELSGTYVTSACEENMKMFRRTAVQNENENEMEVNSGTLVREAEEERVACEEAYLYENSDCTSGNGKLESCNAENECKLEGTISVSKHVEIEKSNEDQGPCIPVENDLHTEANQDGNEMKENAVEVKPALGTMRLGVSEKKMSSAKETSWPDYGVETREAQPELQQNEKKQNADQTPSVVENIIDPGVLGDDHTERENGKFKEGNGVLGSEEAHPHCDAAQEDFQRVADEDIGDVQQGSSAQNKDLGDAAEDVFRKSRSSSHDATETPGTVVSENSESGAHKREKMDSEETIERETCHDKEQARILEEEKEREREREKDRLAVERATREAHERAITEARERAERIAVERVTAEARQRALAEAREKAEKASAEALEKALVEKALKEAKLRAERAAVERATAEARERAVEKALAERAAADARQRAERLNSMSRDKNRKENEAGDSFRASDKEDREIKLKPSSSVSSEAVLSFIPHVLTTLYCSCLLVIVVMQDVLQDIRFKSTGSSSSSQRDSSAHGNM